MPLGKRSSAKRTSGDADLNGGATVAQSDATTNTTESNSNGNSSGQVNQIEQVQVATPTQTSLEPVASLEDVISKKSTELELPYFSPSRGLTPIGVGQAHGITIPEFNPNQYIASDLFTDSSTLQRTKKIDADKAVEAIEERRQTMRVVNANLNLNKDIVKGGVLYNQLLGTLIDYGISATNNATKLINYEVAGITQQVAGVKREVAREQLTQESYRLTGVKSLSSTIQEEWKQRKALAEARVRALEQSVLQANSTIDVDFRNALEGKEA